MHLQSNSHSIPIPSPIIITPSRSGAAPTAGRGVKMVTDVRSIPPDTINLLVQHYIERPLTIDGYKFDLRIYVALTCLEPLRIYVYDDGLVRFATQRYSPDRATLKERCMHLTNYSVNKESNGFVFNQASGRNMSLGCTLNNILLLHLLLL